MTGPTVTLLDDHLAGAERRLVDAAGSQALCAVARSGAAIPAVKYHEGARAALAGVRRRLRDGAPDTHADLAAATDAIRGEWRRQAQRGVPAGPDWEAYRTGGLEALDALVEDLAAGAG